MPNNKSNSWYEEYHSQPPHKILHWTLFIIIAVGVGALVLSAINKANDEAILPPSTNSAADNEPVVVVPAPQDEVITLEDNNQSLHMRVGEKFLLKLGEGYTWTVSVNDPTVLSQVKGFAVVKGAQGLFEGNKTGNAVLKATGKPSSSGASVSFKFNVTVMPSQSHTMPDGMIMP